MSTASLTDTTHTPTTGATPSAASRVAGLGGIAFMVLLVVSLALVGDSPLAGDDAAAVRDYLRDSVGSHQMGILAISLALLPAIVFFAGLASRLRASDRDHGEHWGLAVGLFGSTAMGLLGLGLTIDAGLTLSRDADIADGTLLALWDISMASSALMALAFGGAALSAAIPALLHKTQPAWQGWLGVLVAALAVAGLPALVSDSESVGSIALLMIPAFILWVLVTSSRLIRS